MRLLLLLAMLMTLACNPGDEAPKEPVWGKQPCEHCAMLLSEKEHGAQLVSTGGERFYFDDLGCMVAWLDAHPAEAAHKWVHTADSQAWLAVEKAGFDRAAHTPMDFGFIATAKPGPVDWQQVTAVVRQKLKGK